MRHRARMRPNYSEEQRVSDRASAEKRIRKPQTQADDPVGRQADNARPLAPRQRCPEAVDGDGRLKLMDKPSHDPHRRIVLLVSIPLAVATLAFGILFLYNHVLAGGAVFLPVEASAEEDGTGFGKIGAEDRGDGDETAGSEGFASATVRYLSEIVDGNSNARAIEPVSTPVVLDDRWFEQDSAVYNHELARTCIALCAVVNSESSFYGGRTDIDFVAEALGDLGFSDIRTDSYAKRSVVGDEVAAIFTGETDVTAYALAHRTLADGRDLVFVGIRGTYGSEWLSNFNLADNDDSQHSGFTRAEDEIAQALADYCSELGIDTESAVALVCGHSRGGAVANLLAATLDDGSSELGFAPERVYAYTFAAPNTTQATAADSSLYDNIFNVVNATDVIPRLPLEAWGWKRYGVTVGLPAPGTDGFAEAYEAMQRRRAEITGYYNAKSPFPEAETNVVDEAEARIAESIPDFASLMTIGGITEAVKALGSLSVGQVVASHYPDTYLSWLQTLEPDQLTFE